MSLAPYHDAVIFAERYHLGQVRKYTGEPYVNHCKEVATILLDHGVRCPDMIRAAVLHDVLEDTNAKLWQLVERFGSVVANYVWWLTDQYTSEAYPELNRAQRKALEAKRLADAPHQVKTIKLADLISNTSTIVMCDPGFARVYLKEKRRIVESFNQPLVNQSLWLTAWETCRED